MRIGEITCLREAVNKPLGKLTITDHGWFKTLSNHRPRWVNAFHGTNREISELCPVRGYIWATMTPQHASSYAQSVRGYSRGDTPVVHLLKVNVAGFLFVDGQGEHIRDLDRKDRHGDSPYTIAQQYNLPGILFKSVIDNVDEDFFSKIANVLAISDKSRIKPLFS